MRPPFFFCVFLGFLIVFILFLLLVLPIILVTHLHLDVDKKMAGFSIRLFGFIKLLGGYIRPYKGGIALHVSEKKAILLPIEDWRTEQKRISFYKCFRLIACDITTESGAEYLLPLSLAQICARIIFFISGGKKEKISNNVWLTDGNVLRISLRLAVYINIYILLGKCFLYIKESIKSVWQKKMKKSTT